MDRGRENIGSLADTAEESNSTFYLENADECGEPAKIARSAALCENIRICLSIGHFYERIPLPDYCKRMGTEISIYS